MGDVLFRCPSRFTVLIRCPVLLSCSAALFHCSVPLFYFAFLSHCPVFAVLFCCLFPLFCSAVLSRCPVLLFCSPLSNCTRLFLRSTSDLNDVSLVSRRQPKPFRLTSFTVFVPILSFLCLFSISPHLSLPLFSPFLTSFYFSIHPIFCIPLLENSPHRPVV